jgi:hypothetical protein
MGIEAFAIYSDIDGHHYHCFLPVIHVITGLAQPHLQAICQSRAFFCR